MCSRSSARVISFASFQNLINGPHGSVHGRVGGDMCCVPTASYDPIFFLHHANVDRIWARWQTLHPGPLPASEASWTLPPFNRPFSTQWQTGSDVESTDALGYRYRTLCFILPPFRIWDVVVFPWPPPIRTRFEKARLVVKSTRMQEQAIEVRVEVALGVPAVSRGAVRSWLKEDANWQARERIRRREIPATEVAAR